ncbi:MAG: rhodanese-like domain-containing protein [Candidatus Kapabacteria bacterium]|nr:rhodanese-like domain-containing protein [Candidatus Kapabacteria bacterium]
MFKLHAAVLMLLLSCAPAPTGRDISVDETASMIRADTNVVLVDVRTADEYASGHLHNSRLMDYYKPGFHRALQTLPRNKDVILYCRSGRRSAEAKHFLDSIGYTRVYNMAGGIIAWNEHHYPVEK